MFIRNETPADIESIHSLNYAAFKNHTHHEPGAEPTEHLIVDNLRAADALTLSLVAEQDGAVVGHVAISPVTIGEADRSWFGLGPVAVLPELQNRGIGSKLIRTAIEKVKKRSAGGIVVMGDPKYYGRFGFKQLDTIVFPGVPAEYFMALPLLDTDASGDVAYHPAFS